MAAKIVPIASGKGGVGKSILCANLSLCLAEEAQSVVVVDLDLGGSNLHTLLGIKNNLKGLGHFIHDNSVVFSEIIQDTKYSNLRFISGDALFIGTANLPFFKKKRIMKELNEIEADWVLLDLGAGSSVNMLDFYTMSEFGILVVLPELTSILNLYSFLKNAYYRHILHSFSKKESLRAKLVDAARMRMEKEDFRFIEVLRLLKRDYPEFSERIDEAMENFYPKLILNMATSGHDIRICENLSHILHKNLGLDIEYIGILPYEPQIKSTLNGREPLLKQDVSSVWKDNCSRIAKRLLQCFDYPKFVFEENTDWFSQIKEDCCF